MAASVSFSVDAPCSGGEHVHITAKLVIEGVEHVHTFHIERENVKDLPEQRDIDSFLRVMVKLFARQLTHHQLQEKVNKTVINLTPKV